MGTYRMKERELPLDERWDVIVVGGGPAGAAAATAAAREGAKALLVEATGALGGMGTSGLVPAWCPFTDGEKIIHRGIAEKVFTTCKAGMAHLSDDRIHGWLPLDPERLKRIYDDLVSEAGAAVLFHTVLGAVELEQAGTVSAVILANKAGLTAHRAAVYVDCTGDADLAVWAGAAFEQGDEKGEVQPATHCFVLSNVDPYHYEHGPSLYAGSSTSPIWKILDSGKYPLIRDEHVSDNFIGPGTVGFNAGHLWDVDGTDPRSVSKAMMEGRRIAEEFRRALAELHPKAFAGAYVAATAPLMGIRESRRIVGDCVLTIDDYLARRSFPDEIARNCYMIDIHTAKEEVEMVRKEHKQAVLGRFPAYAKGESHGIPYRCLIPRGLRNILVAGRSISTDRTVNASVRVMPVCLVLGEAAGVAAAMAARADHDVRGVDAGKLRTRLRELGAYLPDVSSQDNDKQRSSGT